MLADCNAGSRPSQSVSGCWFSKSHCVNVTRQISSSSQAEASKQYLRENVSDEAPEAHKLCDIILELLLYVCQTKVFQIFNLNLI